jgi:hypothetical protein
MEVEVVKGTRTVRVRKRDGFAEDFDAHKLAGAMWRAMLPRGRYGDAFDLAMAIQLYLQRTGRRTISSAAIFEMTVKVLRRVRMNQAADALEAHRSWRSGRRLRVNVCDGGSRGARWNKGWLVRAAARAWNLSRSAARIVAGRAEAEVLAGGCDRVPRDALIERVNVLVSEFGLADAVPVHRSALE